MKFWKQVETFWNENGLLSGALVLIGLVLVVWSSFSPQSPGFAIGLLACVAGIMSVRSQMRPAEKFAWIFVLVAFTILEVHAIHRSDEENKTTRDQENDKFQSIANGLKAEIDNTRPRASFGPPVVDYLTPMKGLKETPIVYNIAFRNLGTDAARQVMVFSNIYPGKPNDVTTETILHGRFEADWKAREKRDPPFTMQHDESDFLTFHATPFAPEDRAHINKGEWTIYTLTRIAYHDQTGDWFSDDCNMAQLPIKVDLAFFVHRTVAKRCVNFVNAKYKAMPD